MSELSMPAPRVTLDVTAEAIAEAIRCERCMIAATVRVQVPGATGIRADLQAIRWTDGESGLRYVYLTPWDARQALIRFDLGDETLDAFTVELGLPGRSLVLDADEATAWDADEAADDADADEAAPDRGNVNLRPGADDARPFGARQLSPAALLTWARVSDEDDT